MREFTWDYRNRLTGVVDKTAGTVTQQVSYTYDALNQRLAKTVGTQTTRFVYDRGNVYLEFSGTSTTPSTRYLYDPMVDQVLAQESNGQTTWMLTDHLGSVRDLVNNSGAVVNHFTYDSFGQVVGSTAGATVDTRYKFTGREYDSETGLYYYRARYFDAGVGRFIGQDPIGFGAGDSNLYRYVGNSPINNIDPSGLQVRGTYNVDSGDLELYDVSKPYKHARAKAFSGEDHTYRGNRMRNNSRFERFSFEGPIPRGIYEILDVSGSEYKRLDYKDGSRNDWREDLNRGEFRLHPGTASAGCITVNQGWSGINALLKETSIEIVPDNALSKLERIGFPKAKRWIQKYGEVKVIGTGAAINPDLIHLRNQEFGGRMFD